MAEHSPALRKVEEERRRRENQKQADARIRIKHITIHTAYVMMHTILIVDINGESQRLEYWLENSSVGMQCAQKVTLIRMSRYRRMDQKDVCLC